MVVANGCERVTIDRYGGLMRWRKKTSECRGKSERNLTFGVTKRKLDSNRQKEKDGEEGRGRGTK